jgi:DNA-binding beta-propeller fold protein YncE
MDNMNSRMKMCQKLATAAILACFGISDRLYSQTVDGQSTLRPSDLRTPSNINNEVADNSLGAPTSLTIRTLTIPTSSFPTGVAVNSVTNKIYVSLFQDVAVIDGATNAVTTVPIGP